VAGANILSNELTGSVISSQELTTLGAFGQLALHRKRWPEIDLGLRTDAPAGYDVQMLPSIAALFKVNDRFLLRTNIGTGYQLPDRSRNYGLVYEGVIAQELAPGTKPERSVGGTVEWTWKRPIGEHTFLFIDQTFFGTLISDPLTSGSAADGTTQLTNANGNTLTRGVDNYIRIKHGHSEVYLGYTFTLPEFVANGTHQDIPYTPQHRAATTLSREFGEHWRAGIEAAWSGQQTRSDGTSTRDQLFLAGMVGYQRGAFTVVLNGENLSDTRQTRWEPIVSGSSSRPLFAPLWAPIDGRAINLSVMFRI
jgi:outer membrane cobalamin receptor